MSQQFSINLYHRDCMVHMATVPDKHYDLAIVDPPYGLGDKLAIGGTKHMKFCERYQGSTKWDIAPSKEYFNELFRISKNQIICGGNYFHLPPSRGFIVWEKKQPLDNFSKCEYLWSSFDRPANLFSYSRSGGEVDKNKFHPTQKPVALYKWLLHNYAKPGDKILDTHLGSGSIAIACHEMGFSLDACEIDADYHAAAVKRYQTHISQTKIAFV